ncbi:DNA-processing protein DprA [Streptosporangium sp. NPDC050855]|uniref:DNA-processing protein DprA n=1 Tax=Streptosporangium sp. NPDC050855 TaxID=3366194 RepID=UPI00379E5A27
MKPHIRAPVPARWESTPQRITCVCPLSVPELMFIPESAFEMVISMSSIKEKAAVLALTKATAGQWHHTARVIRAGCGALRLVDGDFIGLDEDDRAHIADVVRNLRPGDLAWAERLIADARTRGAQLITVLEKEYPGNLELAYDLQPFLWIRGRLLANDYRAVAVIGEHDIDQAVQAARALAGAGLTIVAGLRSEIDVAIHKAALSAGGRTLAVLASGINEPATVDEYASMAKEIAADGALVSQFWPDTAFTQRTVELTRIVTCGLAAAVHVVDGRENGFSFRCVEGALKTGKHVFVHQRLHQEQPWIAQAGFRGGITTVQDIDALCRQAVNIVDMTSQPTVY